MAQKKPAQDCDPQKESQPGGTTSGGTTGGETGGGTSPGSTAPSPNQILQSSWTTSVDTQTAQLYTGLSQIRQARSNKLQRQVVSLTAQYGAKDPRVVAAQTSLSSQQTFATRLGMVKTTTSTTAPTAPANGWVVYGRILNADQSAAPQLTVFLADEKRAWLQKYAYAFTDQTGYFTLTYAPHATTIGKKMREKESDEPEHLTAYLEVSNQACQLMYVDSSQMSIAEGGSIYRDILLSSTVPLGTPPCEPGAPPSVPPHKK